MHTSPLGHEDRNGCPQVVGIPLPYNQENKRHLKQSEINADKQDFCVHGYQVKKRFKSDAGLRTNHVFCDCHETHLLDNK